MFWINCFKLTLVAMAGLGISQLSGQTPTLQTVPLSADIEILNVRTLSDGSTLHQEKAMRFYRRADGSTRLEEPGRVVIVDNAAQTVTVLDLVSKTAQVQANPRASASGTNPVATHPQLRAAGGSLGGSDSSAKTDLGVRVIDGYSVHGIQRSMTIPVNSALGNSSPIIKTIQVWRSSDLRLPLLTVISDPLGGTTTSHYKNVSTTTVPDSSLFTIPAEYKTVPSLQSRIIESKTN